MNGKKADRKDYFRRKWIKGKDSLYEWFRNQIGRIGLTTVFGVLIYFTLMSQNLVNHLDGIWHYSNFVAGDWEISIGRFAQRYFDKFRFGLVSESFNTILSLVLISVAIEWVLDLFEMKNKLICALFAGIVIANATVCNSLTYSYLTINFFLAFLFSVASVKTFLCFYQQKKLCRAVMYGGFFLMLCMACYQAYFSVICLIILFYFIKKVIEQIELKKLFCFLAAGALMIVCGGILYYFMTRFMLWYADTAMATYKGANEASAFDMILAMPNSVMACYQQFLEHFFRLDMYLPLHFSDTLIILFFVFIICCVMIQTVLLFRRSIWHAVLFLLGVLLLPVASNAVLLLATGNSLMPLMTMSLVLLIPLSVILIPVEVKMQKVLCTMYLAFMALFLWFGMSTVVNDQLALQEGRNATVSLANHVVDSLLLSDRLDGQKPVALVGRPAENPLFVKDHAFQTSNAYARFGCFSTGADTSRSSWMGVFHKYCGMDINLCSPSTYEKLVKTDKVADLPVYPAHGSIQEIDGVIVVKISELF